MTNSGVSPSSISSASASQLEPRHHNNARPSSIQVASCSSLTGSPGGIVIVADMPLTGDACSSRTVIANMPSYRPKSTPSIGETPENRNRPATCLDSGAGGETGFPTSGDTYPRSGNRPRFRAWRERHVATEFRRRTSRKCKLTATATTNSTTAAQATGCCTAMIVE